MKSISFLHILIFSILSILNLPQTTNAQANAKISFCNTEILIDGIIDDAWALAEKVPVTNLIVGTLEPDSNDCSGYFKALWNDTALFVLMQALDDTLYTADPIVYENDGFEIYIDVENQKKTEYDNITYQFRFIPGSTEISGRWGLNVWAPPPVDFAIQVDTGTSRTIEAVFPLINLGRVSPISDGQKIGFEVEILDNDGQGRDYVLSWNINDHMAWYDPTKMGTIEFDNGLSSTNNFINSRSIIYPNPTTDEFSIKSEKVILNYSIYTLQGELIASSSIHSKYSSVNIENFTPGLYIIKLKDLNYIESYYKILKK